MKKSARESCQYKNQGMFLAILGNKKIDTRCLKRYQSTKKNKSYWDL